MSDQSRQGLLSSFLQRQRINTVKKFISGDVLDFGCGNGQLVENISAKSYIGFDQDDDVVKIAREDHPGWDFTAQLPVDRSFDTIVMLAVIEHIHKPETILTILGSMIKEKGRIIITTPHPSFNTFYKLGARIGLFSRSACDEHEKLIVFSSLSEISDKSGLKINYYRRFLAGANQLFILSKK